MREVYVYYQLRSADAHAAGSAVLDFQARLCTRYATLTARLLRRPEATDERQTWMEVYATDRSRAPDGVTEDMQSAIAAAASALEPWLIGARHTEVFVEFGLDDRVSR
ncbi:MAG: DUF4936 family protein [Pseudomonadota bacterium]|nr:DUF4936 family protein [Pseudomonadota bacterium]